MCTWFYKSNPLNQATLLMHYIVNVNRPRIHRYRSRYVYKITILHNNISVMLSFYIVTTPSNPIVTPNAIVSQYFSGIEKDFICLFTINSAIDNDPDAVVKTEWRKGDSLITGDSRLSVTTTTKLESTYIAQLQFQYLTQLDSDNYSCDVVITSKVNDGFIKDTSVSSSILINVEG